MTKSNAQGRALEYCFVNKLQEFCIGKKISFSFSSRAIDANIRDKVHFNSIPDSLQEDFIVFSNKAIVWLEQNLPLENVVSLSLDRLPDTAGVEGDVTDIHLEIIYKNSPKKEICVSIKHHHDALKHPRLSRIPEMWCAVLDKNILLDYIKKVDMIWDDFIKAALLLIQNPATFKELKYEDPTFIDINLYTPLNNHVISFLKAHASSQAAVSTFFKFITGTDHDFYVIKNEENQVVIKKFIGIVPPTLFEVSILKPSTFLIKFNNGWNISFRLHTASSRLFNNGKINKSVKYDVICQNLDTLIDIESISKAN